MFIVLLALVDWDTDPFFPVYISLTVLPLDLLNQVLNMQLWNIRSGLEVSLCRIQDVLVVSSPDMNSI